MNNSDLSIVILSFNTLDITRQCLQKLHEAKIYCEGKLKNKIEVIVLDNGSTDGSARMVEKEFPRVRLKALRENSGFSKGNNMAMKMTRNPYILLLNSDVYVSENSLYKTLAYFNVNPNCDVLGAKLNYASGKLQPSAGNLPNPVNLISWIAGLNLLPGVSMLVPPFHPANSSFFSKAHRVGWITGAFFALKREVFEKTSGFDEKLFMYMEEVEWCRRIKSSGYKIWYVPSVEAVHLHGASSNFDFTASFGSELKGVRYYLDKYYSRFYLAVKPFLILGLILRIIAFSLIGKTKRARVYMEGLRLV